MIEKIKHHLAAQAHHQSEGNTIDAIYHGACVIAAWAFSAGVMRRKVSDEDRRNMLIVIESMKKHVGDMQ